MTGQIGVKSQASLAACELHLCVKQIQKTDQQNTKQTKHKTESVILMNILF